jgi:hypothetical protein
MKGSFLVPESNVHAGGDGAAVALEDPRPDTVLVTLGITSVVEQEALMVRVQGSADGQSWDAHPLAVYPQKFYAGVSSVLIDLSKHPEVRFLRAEWKAQRWGRGEKNPHFTFYVFAEPA